MFDRGGRLISAVVCIAAIGGVAWWVTSRGEAPAVDTAQTNTQLDLLREIIKKKDLASLDALCFGFRKPLWDEEIEECVELLSEVRTWKGQEFNYSVMWMALSQKLPGTESWYNECLLSNEQELRLLAATHPRSLNDIEKLIDDTDSEVRMTAIMHTPLLDEERVLAVIRKGLGDKDEVVKVAAVIKCRAVQSEEIADDIVESIGVDATSKEALSAVKYFGFHKLHDYADYVQSMSAHEDPLVRAEAILTLRSLTTDDRSDQVIQLIDDPSTDVQNAVVSYLLYWDNGSYVERVEPLLKEPKTRRIAESYVNQYRFGKSM